jgi:hypothetical protein
MAVRDWNTLREVAAQGYSDGVVCLATIETVERSNQPGVYNPLNEADAGRAARLLVDSALTRLHIFVCRGFAPIRHPDDLHLRAAIDFLKQPGRLDEEHEQDHRKNLVKAVKLFDEADRDPRLARLNYMRHKLIAHMARYDEKVGRPTYDDLFGFSRLTTQIWERLSFGAGTVMINLEYQIEAYRESADAFWSKWEQPKA